MVDRNRAQILNDVLTDVLTDEKEFDSQQLRAYADEVGSLAQEKGIRQLKVTGQSSQFAKFKDEMSAAEVVDVALHVGAKWLSITESLFDPEEHPALDDALEREDELAHIMVIWMADGVMYSHTVYADWYMRLILEEAVSQAELGDDRESRRQARVLELSAILEADVAFRGLPNQHDAVGKQILLKHLTEADEDLNPRGLAYDAVTAAKTTVKARCLVVFDELFRDEQEFVEAAIASGLPPKFETGGRLFWVREFLIKRSGGYLPPTRTVQRFESALRSAGASLVSA